MTHRRGRRAAAGRWAVACGLAVAVVWTDAGSAQRTRNVLVRPDNNAFADEGVAIELRMETVERRGGARAALRAGGAVRVGERIVLCFRASADGWATVWSQDAAGGVPARIYPNEFAAATADTRGARVEGGAETCLGDDDGFRLEVGPPLGDAEVYLHYTRDEAQQFDDDAFPQIRATRAPDNRPYASSTLRYRVVD